MNKLLTLFKSGWFITLIGIALLAVLIWLGGPYLGIGDSQPLASPVSRLVLIMLIVVVWAAWLQIQQLRARSKAKQMSGDMAGQDAKTTGNDRDERSATERSQLQGRFQEAIDTLRKSRRGGGNLYTLPWYVVIGPPGSGKSTLLQNSGLNFPLSDRFGKEALRGIVGTENSLKRTIRPGDVALISSINWRSVASSAASGMLLTSPMVRQLSPRNSALAQDRDVSRRIGIVVMPGDYSAAINGERNDCAAPSA